MSEPVRDQVFISYSHKDAKYLDELRTHLTVLQRECGLSVWSDEAIKAGDVWRKEIQTALRRARVGLLLVSPDFLASDFIAKNELPQLLAAVGRQDLRIFWVPVRKSLVEKTPISDYQAAWPPDKPLDGLRGSKRNDAWVGIARQLLEQAANP